MALDEPRDADEVLDVSGYTFVIEKDLYAKAQPLKVNMGYMGFEVSSGLELGGGGCGSSCSGGSCSTAQ
jgi:hypothetical protein